MSLALNTVVCNEEDRIVGLLGHASAFCDELVVVVDPGSEDGTYDLARDFGAKTLYHPTHSDFCEPQRIYAAEHTHADWILLLDGDEYVALERLPELLALDRERYGAAKLPRLGLVDGIPIHDQLDAHVRWFERGTVRYGTAPHTSIFYVAGTKQVFEPQTHGWIINAKTMYEQRLDEARSARIFGGESPAPLDRYSETVR